MTNLKRKLITGIASGAILLNALTPFAFADTTIQISGNGSSSDNTANVSFDQSTTVVQNNTANVSNNVDVDADTGDNDAEDNTGGDVSIETGDADVDVDVSNTLNSNSANVDCCQTGDTEVLIQGNGTNSDNDANLNLTTDTGVFQDNYAYVKNDVDVDADTGNNDAKDNTGGDVTIETGDADVSVSLATTANANWAQVGSSGQNGDISLRILGNGSNSDNTIKLWLDNSVLLAQNNSAYIHNDVDVDADTGDNDAEDNTGGDVTIETGDANVDVDVDNAVNFNWADVNCGCLLEDLLAKIDGNGTDSDNDINAWLSFNQGEEGSFQDNDAYIDNDLDDLDADTGNNDNEDNTAEGDGDPSIETGDADVDVDVNNSGNVNVLGGDSDFEWPDFNFDVEFSLSLSELLALLGLLG